MVEMAVFNVPRAMAPKIGEPELQFMCSASHLIVLFNIFYVQRVATPKVDFCYLQFNL